jgi:hypothetical protein
MLHEFLRIIRDGDSLSLVEVSRALNVPPDMALRMAKQLAQRGYLQEAGVDCSTPRTPCADCPARRSCQVFPRQWILTEKGKAAVAGAGLGGDEEGRGNA